MITRHEANTAWWGRPAAIVTDAAFFDAPAEARSSALEPYEWAEFKAPLAAAPSPIALARAGFALADVQVNFRIALAGIANSPSLAHYVTGPATPLGAGANVRAFEHERFALLPGVTPRMLNDRYLTWANDLIARHPEWCLQILMDGKVQGWFLAEPDGARLRLTLGMLAAGAVATGAHLYSLALRDYARRGAAVGHAAFSVRNTPVMNIYSQLGAVFTPPTGIWLWVSPSLAGTP